MQNACYEGVQLMSIMETYYLIDLENVHEEGLSGYDKLRDYDQIHIFSTDNSLSKNLPLYSIVHPVPVGAQSLDKHLIAYLGLLMGRNINNQCKYVIVSKDTGYDSIISFLKKEGASEIIRQTNIGSCLQNNTMSKAIAIKSSNTTNNDNKATVTSQQKTQLNAKIQRAVSNAGYKQPTINEVAAIVVKHYGEDRFANNVHNELRDTYDKYSHIYETVRPIINQYSSTANKSTNTVPQYENKVKNILRKAGFNNNIVTYVASIISQNYNKKNAKQIIYGALVKKYGQAQGLNIYNHIKSSL